MHTPAKSVLSAHLEELLALTTHHKTVSIVPMGKPRMTQRDRWKKRPVVLRYHDFADEIRAQMADMRLEGAITVSWIAYLPMPPSWSQKKRIALAGQLHGGKPDRDNIDKAILDALFKEDSAISVGFVCKRWDDGGGARIELYFGCKHE